MLKSWMNLMRLGLESQHVIALRMARLSQGGAIGQAEANRMVMEKLTAAALASATIMAGAGHDKVVQDYRRTVRANARRLKRR